MGILEEQVGSGFANTFPGHETILHPRSTSEIKYMNMDPFTTAEVSKTSIKGGRLSSAQGRHEKHTVVADEMFELGKIENNNFNRT